MDYSKLTKTITADLEAAVKLINNPEIAPEVRQLNQEILFREVGQAVYDKIYDMNAWDMDIPHTKGSGIDNRHYGMAKVASNSVSTGNLGLHEYIVNYINNMMGKAQKDAMTNARQSGKKPKVTRTERTDACKWCRSLAGTYEDPPPEVFARHGGCAGKIITEGYKSRNGELQNYKKKAGSTPRGAAAPIARDGGQVVYRGTGNNAGNFGNILGDAVYVARDRATASQFGSVNKLSLPLKSKDILQITSDTQLDKLVLDAQRWSIKKGGSLQSDQFIPAYLKNKGYKAAEIDPRVDPLGGIAVFDPATIKKLEKQLR